ncbi:MAG: hypothetical protein GF353_04680 [Candidatus Lokiarchaeota archaeon]|nr:hypothetical protein [Candidatus Lokiarchaeota archaeon]
MTNNHEIPRVLINDLNNLFLLQQWVDKQNLLLTVLRISLDLAKKSSLSIQHFLTELKNIKGDFFLYNDIKKDKFVKIVFPCIESIIELLVPSTKDELIKFFIHTKYEIQRLSWREIFNGGNPLEKFGRELILQRISGFFDNHGYVYKEVQDGRGFLDIMLLHDNLEIVIETKLSSNYKDTQQLQIYLENKPYQRIGYFIIFDESKDRKFEKFCDVTSNRISQNKNLSIINIWINPPQPSTGKHQ